MFSDTVTSAVDSASSDRTGRIDRPNLTLWESFSLTVLHALVGRLLALLTLRGLYRFGQCFGTIEWLINYRRRRRFAAMLRRVLGREPGSRERARIIREFFMRSRCDKLLYLVIDRVPRDQAASLLTIENKAVLDEALSRRRGVYMAMSHHGAHHVIAMLLAIAGYKTAGVRDRHEGALRRYVQDRFDRRYPDVQRMRVLFADAYPREIYRCLRDGYMLGSAMDVNRTRGASQKVEEVTIFGEVREFLSGPLHVAIRCRTPVLQAFIVPEEDYHYRLAVVGTLIDPDTANDDDKAVAAAMRTYAANVERYVRTFPWLLSRV